MSYRFSISVAKLFAYLSYLFYYLLSTFLDLFSGFAEILYYFLFKLFSDSSRGLNVIRIERGIKFVLVVSEEKSYTQRN